MKNILLTLLLAGLTMVGPLAIDTYLPSFPAIAATFSASPMAIQQTLSLFLFTFAFMMLFYGTLSDSFGRRPVILWSLVLYILASLGGAMAGSFGFLLGARILQGLASGAGSVIGRAIVQDRFDGIAAQKMLGNIMMVFGLAPAIAPVLGGWMQVTFGWRSIFWFLAAFGLLMWVSVWRWLPESLPRGKRHPLHLGAIARNYWMVLKHRQFLLLSVALGAAFGGFALYIGSAAYFIMEILKLPETAFAWLFIPLISGHVLGATVSGKLAHRLAPPKLIGLSYALMALAAALNVAYNWFFAASVPWAVLPLFLFSFSLALAMPPLTLAGMNLFPEHSGLAASMQSFLQMMLFALVSGLVAPLLFGSALYLAFGLAACLVVSYASYRGATHGQARPQGQGAGVTS